MKSLCWSLVYRLRTWRGFLKLHWMLFERKWGVIALCIASAVFGLYQTVPSQFQSRNVDITAILILLMSVFFLRRDVRDFFRAISNVYSLEFEMSQISARFDIPDPYSLSGYGFENHPRGVAIYSRKVNNMLRIKASSILLREENFPFDVFDKKCDSVPEWARNVSPHLLRQAFQGKSILFNSAKVRMVSDLLLASLEAGAPTLTVQKTDYFSSLCTNEAVLRRVSRRGKSDEPMLKEFQFLYSIDDISGHPAVLATLRKSPCANHIGVSTIGITEGGYIVWNTQSGRSAQNTNQIAPSGSGSADYADLRAGDTLLGFLTRAMERELREECGIAQDIAIRTEIIGYARILHRGGKPEFFGVSRIGCRKENLGIPAPETPFQSGMYHTPSASREGSVSIRNILEETDALRKYLGGAFSFQMHLNVTFLERYLKNGG